MDELGLEIRRLREARGLTQVQLAVRANVSPTVVNQVESGKRRPTLTTVEKLAAALDVAVSELFGGKESTPPIQPSLNNELAAVEAGLPEAEPRLSLEYLQTAYPRHRELAGRLDQLSAENVQTLVEAVFGMLKEVRRFYSGTQEGNRLDALYTKLLIDIFERPASNIIDMQQYRDMQQYLTRRETA